MTTNPFAPPRSDIASAAVDPAPAPKSFARRLSFALAPVGFVGFWGAAGLLAWNANRGPLAESALDFAGGVLVLFAVSANLVGIGIVFAAPRGRRLSPALLNGVSLMIIVAITIVGFVAGTGTGMIGMTGG